MQRRKLVATLGVVGVTAGLVVGGTAAFGGDGQKSNAIKASVLNTAKPRNVIFLLGDGMGVSEITAARYYQGVGNPLSIDRLPLTGFDTTWSIKPAAAPPYTPDLDPDSASTGTMWATGIKTLDERVSQGPSSDISVPGSNAHETVLEYYQRIGKKVGNVSTAEITDATPAVLASHISLRGCQGPADAARLCPTETSAAGGLGSIAEQETNHNIDVLLGGGRARFAQTIAGGPNDGKSVLDVAAARGYRYVTDAAALESSPGTKKVLGLFTNGTMTTEWTGPAAATGDGSAPSTCTETNRPANEPSLAAMTSKALRLLDNPKGFFLQVEGASIDKQDHATNACGQIGETVAFDQAIGVALRYQSSHPDTLVVVSADHSHTSQIVADDSSGSENPTGYSTNLVTKDNAALRLTYGTAGYGGAGAAPVATPPSQQHTGAVVPVWGGGPRAIGVLGTNDHTDLYNLLRGQ